MDSVHLNKTEINIKSSKKHNFANLIIHFDMSGISSFQSIIPEPTLRRLPLYLAYIKLLKKQGETHVSSTQIGEKIYVSSTQIAKDLSYVDASGKTRVGYELDSLIETLEEILGFSSKHKAVLFGVGSLGAALLADSGLEQYSLKIEAGFDVNQAVINRSIGEIPVYHSDEFIERNKIIKAEIGVLTVPSEIAQQVADYMIEGGIRGIWNFTPFRIRVPENIVLQNTSMYADLAVMFNRLNAHHSSK